MNLFKRDNEEPVRSDQVDRLASLSLDVTWGQAVAENSGSTHDLDWAHALLQAAERNSSDAEIRAAEIRAASLRGVT